MPEDVCVSSDGRCILVVSSGPPSLQEMTQTLARIAELRRDKEINRVLVDSRARSGQLPVVDIFAGGKLLSETLGPGIRVAVLVSELDSDHKFFENIVTNRGGAVAFFSDERLAAEWLSRTSP